MKKNKKIKQFSILSLILCLAMTHSAFAYGGHAHGHGGSDDLGLEGKLLKKIYFTLNHHADLKLTEEQIGKLKGLKVNIKSEVIRGNADIDVFAYKTLYGLNEYEIDGDALKKLIQQKHDAMAALDFKVVDAYGELEKILTKEQYQKAKAWWHHA